VLALLGTGYALGLHEALSLETILREHDTLTTGVAENFAIAALAYVSAYVAAVAVSFPGASLLTAVGGFLFGVVFGVIFTVFAATAGASVIFLVAKPSLGAPLRERAGQFAARLARGFEATAFNYLLSLRLPPILPFWLINVAPALFNVKLSTYAAATALGIIPGTVAYNLFGGGLAALIRAQDAANPGCSEACTCAIDLASLISPLMIAALVALSVAALIPIIMKRLRKRSAS